MFRNALIAIALLLTCPAIGEAQAAGRRIKVNGDEHRVTQKVEQSEKGTVSRGCRRSRSVKPA
jgi:hypothetical protein